jgi:tetratricopeptide (TPR) repeat protein
VLIDRGIALWAAGRLEEARAAFAEADRGLEDAHQTSFRSTVVVHRGQVAYELGDLDEAERLVREGDALGAEGDVVNHAWNRTVRARIAVDRGDLATAEELAREGLRFAYETDFPEVHGDAHEALAYALRAAGQSDGARAELEQALALWRRFGFRVREEKLRALLVEL